jgi:outer membrane protein assembly factor BamA
VKTKLGQPPVIYNKYLVERSENDIQDLLFSKGYFDASTNKNVKISDKKVMVTYLIKTNDQYIIDTIAYPEITDSLTKHINSCRKETLLNSGDPYNFNRLKDERNRIDDYLKNIGYYYFSADYLIFELDSNKIEKRIDVFMRVKSNIPERAKARYTIKNIYIDSDHSLEKSTVEKDTILTDSVYFIFNTPNVKPDIITRSVLFAPGNLYSYKKHINTLNKLSSLGIYKFTNINFTSSSEDSTQLNAKIILTQSVPKSMRVKIQAVTKSNDYMGPELSLSYHDRNFLGGAESFLTSLNTSFETQISNANNTSNSYQIGINQSLSVPRFLFPFIDLNKYLSGKYTPKTNFMVGYKFDYRTKYFQLNTFDFLYEYVWRESSTKSHGIKLINLSYSHLSQKTQAFQEVLQTNELIRQSFSEELIASLVYTFTYNNQLYKDKKVNSYFTINPEFAGNALSLYNLLVTGEKPTAENQAEIVGINYSQYARINADYRLYINTSKKYNVVTRLMAGIGKAYGNSVVLPYTRQYYIGGASDIRAFRTHTVGPGSYKPADSVANTYFEQVGDIKLEANFEFRFNIVKIFEGALFVDAGNVWLIDKNEEKPGGELHWNKIPEQLALGAGVGLRLDASVLVVRFDLGLPLRKPWLPENQRWVFDTIDFRSGQWRSNNLVLNIAIGYPF